MKRNKQRRAYLKRFSSEVVNTGKAKKFDKNRQYIMRDLYGDSSMIGTPPDTRSNSYAQNIPKTVTKIEKPWQSDKFQGIDRFQRIVIYNLGVKKLELFFSGKKWFFRKENTGPTGKKTVVVSITYGSKANAEIALKYNRIMWINSTQG